MKIVFYLLHELKQRSSVGKKTTQSNRLKFRLKSEFHKHSCCFDGQLEWTSLKSNDALQDHENKVKWRETPAR